MIQKRNTAVAANAESTFKPSDIVRVVLIDPVKSNNCAVDATSIDAVCVATLIAGLNFFQGSVNGKHCCRIFQRDKRNCK